MILAFTAWSEFRRSGDVLNPSTLFAPMLMYTYVVHPLLLYYAGSLERIFVKPDAINYVQLVNIAFIAAFCFGLKNHKSFFGDASDHFRSFSNLATAKLRKNVLIVAIMFGAVANFIFWYSVEYSGGAVHVFSQRKPFLLSPFGIGYIDELTLLAYPALLLLAISHQGKPIRLRHIFVSILITLPHGMMATLGGRRGATFLLLGTATAAFFIVKGKSFKYFWLVTGICCVGVFLIALNEFRGDLFRIDIRELIRRSNEAAQMGGIQLEGDEFVAASAAIVTATETERYFWGARYFTWFIVRPIPSALWPSKYEDMGMEWMVTRPGSCGFTSSQWFSAAGFEPPGGAAGGFVSDLYIEFFWYGLVISFLIGRLYSEVWYLSLKHGGIWAIFYLELLILSIYLPTQNLEAWLYRVMLLGLLTHLFGKYLLKPPTLVKDNSHINYAFKH